MIPFDFKLHIRILKLFIKHKGFSLATLFYLFGAIPFIIMNNLFHQFSFLLDEIFFSSYRKISTDDSIFIVGPPRCGTSLMLDLLNYSDEITSMKLWEIHSAPSICEKLFFLQMGKVDRFMGSPLFKLYHYLNNKVFGDLLKVHDTSLFHFEEDAMLFYHSANSPFYLFFFPFVELQTPFLDFDTSTSAEYKTKYMNFYKKCIQKHLYVFGKEKIYLSKNPFFSFYVLTLKEHFNNAKFILMARNPYQVVPSAISLSTLYKDFDQYANNQNAKATFFENLLKERFQDRQEGSAGLYPTYYRLF